jgi:hypothetical protein
VLLSEVERFGASMRLLPPEVKRSVDKKISLYTIQTIRHELVCRLLLPEVPVIKEKQT